MRSDERWEEQIAKKQSILMSYNKVSKLDRVWANVHQTLSHVHEYDQDTMEALPDKFRKALGGQAPSRRRMF